MTSSSVTVFGISDSVYTRIARLALLEKGVAFALEEADVFAKTGVPEAHLARHPFGRIPVLRHADFELYETAAIARYVDEAFEGPSLQPDPPESRARMAQIVGLLDAYAYRPMVWEVFVERLDPSRGDEQTIRSGVQRARVCLRALEALRDAEFLAGDALSLADLHAYPMLRFFELAPDGRPELEAFQGLRAWLRRMGERPSAIATRASYEALLDR